MRDLYEELGLTPDASERDIKTAYRALARKFTTDRKGGNKEKMAFLNAAYETLSDAESRRYFDRNRHAFQEADVGQQSGTAFDGYLLAGNSVPYSHIFRAQHQVLVMQYEQTPLRQNTMEDPVQPFESGIYHLDGQASTNNQYHDIYQYIRVKTVLNSGHTALTPTEQITPIIATRLFVDFLSGHYYGAELTTLKNYLAAQIRAIKSRAHQASEMVLYEGISEIVLITDKSLDARNKLIFSIKKITEFAKNAYDIVLASIIPLFYNKYFRNLHAYALHLYWNSSEGLFDSDNLNQFDGYQEAKDLLNVLKERLSSNSENENLSQLIQYIKLIYNFEKDLHESRDKSQTAIDYREAAFHFLDWVPVFIEQSSRKIIVNIFLQIGIKFQQASRLETRPAIKMADEQLALKMYLTAAEIGHNTTPDVEMYANTQAIKYISAFRFQDPMLNEILLALKKRTLVTTDVFPFFDGHQSNVSFVRHENKTLHLMRKLLNAMVAAYEYNKTHSDGISVDHAATTVLYQSYTACIKNWYQEEFDPVTEQRFRVDLMEELLFENAWTILDVEQNVDSSWIMVDRDEQGWMTPKRSLPYQENDSHVKYRTIHGAEINHKTGEINFFMTPWTEDRPEYEKLFTIFDLQEMLEKNISAGMFSLDPVDPYMPFHPYNLMRYAPAQLCETELFNTMLLTDYVLKFLTTNQEVQGQYPFDQRPVASMIQHLPEYLRQIIDDFHSEQRVGALHRFWIEAEEIDVSISDDATADDSKSRFNLGNVKMIVKKHRMERDIHGELKDVGNDDEGWPVYVLTTQQMQELQRGTRVINSHAMIFIHSAERLYYWDNNEIIKTHVPVDYRETLIRLFKQPKDNDGKLTQNLNNMPLIYRATQDMAKQSGLAHRYSSEFVFAHEFTMHYDEFSQYLPEFGRLKELSKMSVLVRLLDGSRLHNTESIKALDFILDPAPQAVRPITATYTSMTQSYQDVCASIKNQFRTWSNDLSTSALQRKQREHLNKMKEEIGTLNFSSYSAEVNQECERQYDYSYRNSKGYSYSEIKRIIDAKRLELASQMSTSKRSGYRSQLITAFSSSSLSSVGQLVDSFLDGNVNPLADALANNDKTKAHQEIKKQFPNGSINDIALALDNPNHAASTRLATEEARRLLREQKELKEKLETGFQQINLGKHEELINMTEKCLWVPASVRHEVKKDDTTGLTRYSFFVYGGVSVQPRINMVSGGGGALRGNSVGGGAFNRNQVTKGFQDHHIASDKNRFTKDHELWKLSGVNVNSRVNKIHLPRAAEQHPTRSVHSGRHTNAYSANMAEKMKQVVDQGKDAGWKPSQYREATRSLLSEMKQELRAGNIALNKNHRPWAK